MNPDRSTRSMKRVALVHADVSNEIIGAFYFVYNHLGFGFLESVYARALEIVLRKKGLTVHREYPIAIHFLGEQIGFHRCDMLVENKVIVEVKATELLAEAPRLQLRNYLAALNLELGILLHFGPRANYHRILGPLKPECRQSDPDASG